MHYKVLYLVIVFLSIYAINCSAQIEVRPLPSFNKSGQVSQRVCVELNNLGPTKEAVINIKIKPAGTDSVILETESPVLALNQGMTQLLPSLVEKFKPIQITDLYFTNTQQLKKGNYIAEIVVRHPFDDIEYAAFNLPVDVSVENSNVKKQTLISTSGSGQVTGVFSTRQQSFSSVPQNYVQGNLSPTVIIAGIPVTAHALFSTAQSPLQQNLNSFSIDYNSASLKALLKNKLEQTLKDNEEFKKLSNWKNSADINQYKSYGDILKNPAVQKDLAEIANLDTLQTLIDTVAYYKALYAKLSVDTLQENALGIIDTTLLKKVNKDSLAKRRDSIQNIIKTTTKLIDKYNQLKAKKEGYDKLLKQKDELENKLKNNGLVDSLGNKIDGVQTKAEDYKSAISSPENLVSNLKKNHLLCPLDKVLLAVNKFEIGTSYPHISALTLNGVRVNGINVELAPKNMFVSFTYGNTFNAVQSLNPQTASYKRRLYSSTVGMGNIDGSYLLFTFVNAVDDTNSITPRDSVFNTLKPPQSNNVLSTHFKLKLLNNSINLFGELAGSQTVRDLALANPDSNTYATVNTNNVYNVKNWVGNIITQRVVNTNTTTDYAFNGGIQVNLFKGKTKLSGMVRRVGSNYQTFGVPFLPVDLLTIEAKVSQQLWKNRIQLGGLAKRNIDNLDGTKISTTQNYQFGGDIRISVPHWPTLRAAYIPLMQQNDSIRVAINILNISSGYNYKIYKIKNIVAANYIRQNSYSADNSVLNFNSENALISHTTILPSNISFTLSANYIKFVSADLPNTNTININVATTFPLFKNKLTNTVGTTLIKNQNEIRYGFFYNAALPLGKHLALNARIENNQYNSYEVNTILSVPYFSEFSGQVSINVNW